MTQQTATVFREAHLRRRKFRTPSSSAGREQRRSRHANCHPTARVPVTARQRLRRGASLDCRSYSRANELAAFGRPRLTSQSVTPSGS